MGNSYTGFSPEAQMDEVNQVEYLLGLPDRVVNSLSKDWANRRKALRFEKDLKILQDAKKYGGEKEFRRMVKGFLRKYREARAWIDSIYERRFWK